MGYNDRPSRVGGIRTPHDAWRRYAPEGSDNQNPDEVRFLDPDAEKDRRDLKDEVGPPKTVESKEPPKPTPVTPEAKKDLEIRTQNDIFGSREAQEYYLGIVGTAMQGIDSDRLHAFIMDHQEYGKSNFEAWNIAFAKLLNVKVEKYQGRNEAETNRRITAAAQHVLVDFYDTDVFELTKKVINPWIFIDGMLGPYTVCVLADYWTVRFGKDSERTPNPPGRTTLNPSYNDRKKSRELYYGAAMKHLDTQLGKSNPDVEPPKPGVDTAEDLAEEVKARYARFDLAGDSLPMSELEIPGYYFDVAVPSISQALGIAYGENPKNPVGSPKLFRVLHLLAKEKGAEIDDMKIKKGETLTISDTGLFTVNDGAGNNRYEIQLYE